MAQNLPMGWVRLVNFKDVNEQLYILLLETWMFEIPYYVIYIATPDLISFLFSFGIWAGLKNVIDHINYIGLGKMKCRILSIDGGT